MQWLYVQDKVFYAATLGWWQSRSFHTNITLKKEYPNTLLHRKPPKANEESQANLISFYISFGKKSKKFS